MFKWLLVLSLYLYLVPSAFCEILFQDDFETGNLSKWIDVSRLTINSNPVNAHSGSSSVQLQYVAGSDDAGWMWKKHIPVSPTGETYIRWYQKWENGFVFNPQPDQKLLMIYGLNPPDEWGQTSDWRTYIHLVGTAHNCQPNEIYIDHLIWAGPGQWDGKWRGFRQNVGSPYGFRTSEWECVEVKIKLNTICKNDGAIRLWINGILKMDYQDVEIRSNDTPLNAIQITGWYSGGAPKNQYTWIDDVVVSDKYVGTADSIPPSSPTNLRIVQ